MAVFDNLHSRLVFWLKIVLPLLALAILSTLFLFSRNMEGDSALPYAQVDLDNLVREQRLTSPEFAGVTADGAALRINAATAFPGTAGTNPTAQEMSAVYETPGGLRIDLSAAEAVLNYQASRMLLSGGVEIVTSTGYHISARGLDAAMDRTELLSDGSVHATAPYGEIAAGGMALRLGDGKANRYVLVFNKGVKLLYQPAK